MLVEPFLTSSQSVREKLKTPRTNPVCPESRDRQVFGRVFGKEGCTRGENPFNRKKGFSPLVKFPRFSKLISLNTYFRPSLLPETVMFR